jgi:hypothetical protein
MIFFLEIFTNLGLFFIGPIITLIFSLLGLDNMSAPKSPDKGPPVPKPSSSANEKRRPTPDTASSDQAAKPIKKKIPKTPATEHTSKAQAVPLNGPPPTSGAPASGEKKIIKKKPKAAADQQSIDNPKQASQSHNGPKQAKKIPKPPEAGTGDAEKPKQAKQAEEHALKQELKPMPSAPESKDVPKLIKKEINNPAPPPEPEPEFEAQDLASQPENEGVDEKEMRHDGERHEEDEGHDETAEEKEGGKDEEEEEEEEEEEGEEEEEEGKGSEREERKR